MRMVGSLMSQANIKNAVIMCINFITKFTVLGIIHTVFASTAFAAGTLDWSAEGYTTGSFNQNYTNIGTPGVNISVVTTGSTNDLNDAGFTTPQINNGALLYFPNFENENETVTVTISFSQAVSDLNFLIRDIDEGGYEDQVTITGVGPSGAVVPTISPDNETPITYTVAGNVATANGIGAGFADESPVTFNSAVTQIVIVYGNGPGFTGNPAGQLIWIGDLDWTNEAELQITKDDSSLTYTPGRTETYTIIVTNNGPGPVTAATILDNLPSGVTLSAQWSCNATAGSGCSAANGGSIGGTVVFLTADIINGGVITVDVPVRFSANMGDY